MHSVGGVTAVNTRKLHTPGANLLDEQSAVVCLMHVKKTKHCDNVVLLYCLDSHGNQASVNVLDYFQSEVSDYWSFS